MLFQFLTFFLPVSNLFIRSIVMEVFFSVFLFSSSTFLFYFIILSLSSYFIEFIFFKVLLWHKVLVGNQFCFLCYVFFMTGLFICHSHVRFSIVSMPYICSQFMVNVVLCLEVSVITEYGQIVLPCFSSLDNCLICYILRIGCLLYLSEA